MWKVNLEGGRSELRGGKATSGPGETGQNCKKSEVRTEKSEQRDSLERVTMELYLLERIRTQKS